MKKLTALLFIATLLVACSKDNEITQQADDSAKFGLDLSSTDNSNLGLYRGVFSTMDSSERGTFDLEIKKGNVSRASLTLVNGMEYKFQTSELIEENMNVVEALFVADGASFKFSVKRDGSNPTFSDVTFMGAEAAFKGLKETSRSPVTAQTGTWTCGAGCSGSGTWNLAFNSGDGSGDYASGGDMVTMIMFNGGDIGGNANTQGSCVDAGNVTTCDIDGTTSAVGAAGGVPIVWTGTHSYTSAAGSNCSEASGTFAAGPVSGTWTSDSDCLAQGNFPFDPIALTINAEGTGCGDPGDNAIAVADWTDSGVTSSSCANSTADVWYSFTASDTGLTVSVPNGGGITTPSFTVFDTSLTEVACNGGGGFGDFTITGLTASTDYLLRVSTPGDIDFCIESFNVPTGPPANDLCGDAIAIACDETVTGNTTTATDSDSSRGRDVWYTFDGTSVASGTEIVVSLCGSAYDTWLGIYDDCAFTTLVASNDDSCGGQSETSFINDGSTNYVIRVDGFNAASFGAYELSISCVIPDPPPANDDCANAESIALGVTVSGDTSDATNSASPFCGTGITSPDVWYVFTAPADADYTAGLCGSGFDTKMQVFDGDCAALNCLGGNDDSCGLQSEVTFTAVAGTDYYILVGGFSSASGAYDLIVNTTVAPFDGVSVEKAPKDKLTAEQQYEIWKNEQQ
ncbi:hypothetical protein [Gilvibacter sp.]|uniref:hypothetical protein n=1 Tax=Gilvibacter sp. TaxID=2729997 RepID=UPI003F4A58C4